MSRSRFRPERGAALVLLAAMLSACTATTRTDTANSFLMIETLAAASGARPDTFGGNLASDVLTLVKRDVGGTQVFVPTVYEDLARVTFRLGMKDPGSTESPTTPSSANFITVTRYRVDYIRADGRNTPGVDVPFGFDGAVTLTVGGATATAAMTLVRIQAKNEAPLKALVGGNGAQAISTIAQITFYGKDQAGRDVSVAGQISVNFADWGDPA
jgi:hypothetical protein